MLFLFVLIFLALMRIVLKLVKWDDKQEIEDTLLWNMKKHKDR